VVRADIASITDLYTQNGYALASVYPDIVPMMPQNNLALPIRLRKGLSTGWEESR